MGTLLKLVVKAVIISNLYLCLKNEATGQNTRYISQLDQKKKEKGAAVLKQGVKQTRCFVNFCVISRTTVKSRFTQFIKYSGERSVNRCLE